MPGWQKQTPKWLSEVLHVSGDFQSPQVALNALEKWKVAFQRKWVEDRLENPISVLGSGFLKFWHWAFTKNWLNPGWETRTHSCEKCQDFSSALEIKLDLGFLEGYQLGDWGVLVLGKGRSRRHVTCYITWHVAALCDLLPSSVTFTPFLQRKAHKLSTFNYKKGDVSLSSSSAWPDLTKSSGYQQSWKGLVGHFPRSHPGPATNHWLPSTEVGMAFCKAHISLSQSFLTAGKTKSVQPGCNE